MNTRRLSVIALSASLVLACTAHAEEAGTAASMQCPNLTQNMQFGADDAGTDGEVTKLQRFLSDYYDLNLIEYVTGYFGRLTRTNVQRFQCERMRICSGSEETNGYGRVGPATRTAIAEACSAAGGTNRGANTVTDTGANNVTSPPRGYAQSGYTAANHNLVNADDCTLDGATVPNRTSRTFYSSRTAPDNATCASISQSRSCVYGELLGSLQFQYATCADSTPSGAPGANGTGGTNSQSGYYSQGTYNNITTPNDCSVTIPQCSSGSSLQLGQSRITGCWTYTCVAAPSTTLIRGNPLDCHFNGRTIANGSSVVAYQSAHTDSAGRCPTETRSCASGSLTGSYQYSSCSNANILRQ